MRIRAGFSAAASCASRFALFELIGHALDLFAQRLFGLQASGLALFELQRPALIALGLLLRIGELLPQRIDIGRRIALGGQALAQLTPQFRQCGRAASLFGLELLVELAEAVGFVTEVIALSLGAIFGVLRRPDLRAQRSLLFDQSPNLGPRPNRLSSVVVTIEASASTSSGVLSTNSCISSPPQRTMSW